MSAELAVDGIILAGSILGAATVTLIPYFRKQREAGQIDGSKLVFDKKFLYTALIAFALGTIFSILNFSSVEAQVDANTTAVKIFATAFGIAFSANWIFNSALKPSSLVDIINGLQAQNEKLQSRVTTLEGNSK